MRRLTFWMPLLFPFDGGYGLLRDQLSRLKEIYGDVADFSRTVIAGDPIPECDAVLFPQMIGAGYHYAEQLKSYDRPVLVITSRFGTVDMWGWELISYQI